MRPLLRPLSVALLLAPSLAACHDETRGPLSPAANPAVRRVDPSDDPGPAALKRPPAAPAARPAPSLLVENVKGANVARTNAAFAPVRTALMECIPSSSGAIVVSFVNKDGSTAMQIAPGSSLDAGARRCALEILSTVDADGVLERGVPGDRPSGFSAQLRIEWPGLDLLVPLAPKNHGGR